MENTIVNKNEIIENVAIHKPNEINRYKICNYDKLNANFNICKFYNYQLEKVKYKYKYVSRSGKTIYNITRVEDVPIYLMFNREVNFDYIKLDNEEGIVITVDCNCNELLEKEKKKEYIDYIRMDKCMIEDVEEKIVKVKKSEDIDEVLYNYNQLRKYVFDITEDIDSYLQYNARRNLFRIMKRNLCIKSRGFYQKFFIFNIYVNINMRYFNDNFYIIEKEYNDTILEVVYKRSNDKVIGYIVNNLLFSYEYISYDENFEIK